MFDNKLLGEVADQISAEMEMLLIKDAYSIDDPKLEDKRSEIQKLRRMREDIVSMMH